MEFILGFIQFLMNCGIPMLGIGLIGLLVLFIIWRGLVEIRCFFRF